MNRPPITPGHWRSEGVHAVPDLSDEHLPHAVIRSPGERWTALVEITDHEGEANARAIAALPDLLSALEDFVQLAQNSPFGSTIEVHESFFAEAANALQKAGYTP